jgi:hypothetical protein
LLHHVRRCVEGRGHQIALQKISLFWYFSLFRYVTTKIWKSQYKISRSPCS